jgi:hypothetical protein
MEGMFGPFFLESTTVLFLDNWRVPLETNIFWV